jgi:hypothetical protein
MQVQQFLLLLALPLLICLSACIIIPVERGDEELFKDERLTFIEVGKSTKEEIATAMSDFAMEKDEGEVSVKLTPKKFRDGDWWLYTQSRKEAKWFFAAAAYGRADYGTIGGDVDYRFLLIKFDNNGVVAGYELSSSEGTGCNRYGVCVRWSRYMLLAPEDEDRVVKQFDIPADRCGVYVYGKPKSAVPVWSYVPIWLDGDRVGWLLDKKQFLFLQLDQGAHQLAPRSPDVADQRPIEFSCAAGRLYFFELKPKRSGFFRPRFWIEIEQRDAVKGRKAIGKRQLSLSMTEPSD